nr:response regulator transcription factor [Brevibacterium otitidis]
MRGISAALTDDGFSVVGSAYSGQEAVELAAKLQPDVVLLDINMPPGMNGIDATAQIRTLSPASTIVILTTSAPGPGIARALEAGAAGILTKSEPPMVLTRALRMLLADDDPRILKRLAETIIISGDMISTDGALSPSLTKTEHRVLRLLSQGLNYEAIAAELTVSPATVRTHAQHLREKLHAQSISQIVYRGVQLKFISID